jgi:hypothetical protein
VDYTQRVFFGSQDVATTPSIGARGMLTKIAGGA